MTWDEVKDLAPLYAIGALDEETARAVEVSLLDATPEQQRVVAQWHDVAALLPQALPIQTPPAYLKERLLSRIAAEGEITQAEIAVGESAIAEGAESCETPIGMAVEEYTIVKGNEGIAEQTVKKVLPFVAPRRIESKTQRWLLIAATAMLAFTSAYLFGQNAKLAREQDEWKQKVDNIVRERDEWKQKVDNIVSPTTRVIAMASNEVPGANAKVVWDTKEQRWVIYIFNLPAPPSDKQYQLWYVTNNAKISAAVFSTDPQGQTVLKLTLPPDALTGLAATAVTLEPKGGSPQPTSDKFYLIAKI
jgi:anti-sigma-K factor RskA